MEPFSEGYRKANRKSKKLSLFFQKWENKSTVYPFTLNEQWNPCSNSCQSSIVVGKYFPYFSTKTCLGYSLEAPWQGASNEYPQHMFSWINSTHNICFCGEIRKISVLLDWTSILSRAMFSVCSGMSEASMLLRHPLDLAVGMKCQALSEASKKKRQTGEISLFHQLNFFVFSRLKSVALDDTFFFSTQKILIFYLFHHKNICCQYSLKALGQGASNEYSQHMFSWRNKRDIYLRPPLIRSCVNFCFDPVNRTFELFQYDYTEISWVNKIWHHATLTCNIFHLTYWSDNKC